MREIPLPGGWIVLVDDEDYDYLTRWRWKLSGKSLHGRVMRSVRKPEGKWGGVYLHVEVAKRQEIWVPGLEIDHRDRDIFNNRRFNLRAATHQQNGLNQGIRKTNSSGYKGVSWCRHSRSWVAQIRENQKVVYLGRYPTPEEAALAYNAAAIRCGGEFAFLNVITTQPLGPDGESVPEAETAA